MNPKQKAAEAKAKKQMMITIGAVVVLIVGLIVLFLCTSNVFDSKKEPNTNPAYTETELTETSEADPYESVDPEQNTEGASAFDSSVVFKTLDDLSGLEYETVKFTMTDGQSFTMNVYPEIAPKTAENFLGLVESGFYDGLTFHRVIEGFMAQGGDPEGTGMGGSAETIEGEFGSNGYYNPLSHQRGVVSMARSNDPDSASSQFFICYDDASFLDGDYASFGFVTEGMEVVDTFLSDGTDANDKPLKDVRIETATIVE